MTLAEMKARIEKKLRGLMSYLVLSDLEEAIQTSLDETGWSFPTTSSFQTYWLIERAKRHVYDMLRAGSAHKFKVEGINLQHRFDHYHKLISEMDTQFEAAISDNPAEFAGVSPFAMFGTKVDAGFQYDDVGKDTTYSDDNYVIFRPNDADQ